MRASLKFLAVPAVAGLLFAAGCGGSSSDTTSSAPSQTATQTTASGGAETTSGTTLQLAADPNGALAYVPTTLTAAPGKVTIKFTNDSPMDHDVVVQNPDGKEVARTAVFKGGTRSIDFTATAGTYTYHCSVPGHTSMKGTLTVQ